MNNKYEIIIVGGGPAGSAAAYVLAKSGKKVLIIDKEKFPRKKLCGGMITEKTVKLIEDVYGEINPSDIIDSTYGTSGFYYKTKVISEIDHSENKVYLVDRYSFDDYFFKKAIEVGCEFLNGKVIAVAKKGDEYKINLESGDSILSNYILGADGANSIIRKTIISGINKNQYTIAIEADIKYEELICFDEGDIFPRVYFGIMDFGYGWIFPKKDKVVVGVGGLVEKNKDNPLDIFKKFVKQVSKENVIIDNNRIAGFPVPFSNFTESPCKDNLFLLGDAAGFVEPITGEGIYFAILSGKLAAEAIINENNYNQEIDKNIIKFLKQGYFVKRIFFNRFILKILMAMIKRSKRTSKNYFRLLSGEIDYFEFIKILVIGKIFK